MNALPRWTRGLVVAFACTLALAGCKSEKQETAAAPPAGEATAAAPVTQTSWAPDALEELVAPIALYPDQLVGQILAASVNSQEVLDAGNWLLANQELKGDALTAAAQKAGFGAATLALIQFPTVVDMMCQEIDWTKQLGAAFTSDQKGVLDAVQRLRTSAINVGNLKTSPQQTVETKSENGMTYVEVKPADPKVVYVPQYDPAVVYTTPPTTTVVESSSGMSSGTTALLAFGVGIAIGAAINNNYYPYPHWGYGAVYMGPRPFYPPAYVYRPVYSPAFRPAYGYHPPAHYHNSYNRQTNITINNNNNYYNRFDHNQNLQGGSTRSPIAANNKAGTNNRASTADRAGTANRASAPKAGTSDWKGKSTYAGAKPGGAAKPSQGSVGGAGSTKAARPANVDRGYGGAGGAQAGTAATRTAAAQPHAGATTSRQNSNIGASGAGSYKQTTDARTGANVVSSTRAPSTRSPSTGASSMDRGDAFSGASRQNSGSFDRAASARGGASTSSRSTSMAGRGGGGGGRR